MKIATYNVNGIRSRLSNLLEWLRRESPDVVCLQELKATDDQFPAAAISDAGYGAIWQGQKSWNGVAILARATDPVENQGGLPGADDDTQSRYIETTVFGLVVGCLYLPNGNPQPGPKFDYKLNWETNSGLRIDHLLLNAELAPRLIDAGVDKWVRGQSGASDHAPTWVILDANSHSKTRPQKSLTG